MNKKVGIICGIMLLCALLSGCEQDGEGRAATPGEAQTQRTSVRKAPLQDVNNLPLKDDHTLYEAYDPLDVVCFYVTVRKGNRADGTDHTFQEVNAYKNLQGMTGVEKIKAEAIFQVGDETGPLPGEVGYGALSPNATINVRGRTSTGYPQKSYRISLMDTAGLWRGQRAIAINKHPGDPTRLRNMVYFRLLQDVPGLTSLRTQYVHLYVKDETDPDAPDAFVDYGLYTQVELPNGRFLRNHGLSQDGDLYKANMCELYRYPDQLKLATDPTYDLAAFSEVLEPKTGNDHRKLIEMLEAVNDYERPIEEVIAKYFDLDNLTSYMAFNMLMANPDSNAQNYLLYSPVNSDTWYYICWDGDGALAYYEDELLENAWSEAEWTRGVSDYWGVVLFNRMLRVESFRNALYEKVEWLHGLITPERINELIAACRTVTDSYTTRMPDAIHMRIPNDKLELIYNNMAADTDLAYAYIMESFKKPMPFYLGVPIAQGGRLTLSWDAAYDFDGEFVRYDVQVATDWTFAPETIVAESLGQLVCTASFAMPEQGDYFWRVVATDESGHSQISFDQISTATGAHGGMGRFTVGPEGSVTKAE